ncbi:hypothetical protein BGZ76_004046 [Entomortierella beljakovae]|nr:hypothetical protein BGZ76_004046 [Entomortierella beljakovae]
MKSLIQRKFFIFAVAIAALISLCATTTSATKVTGVIVGNENVPSPRVLLIQPFSSPDVPAGSYLLQVQSSQFVYPSIRLVIGENDARAHLVNFGTDWSNNDNPLALPLVLVPRATASYFIPREGFKISHLFANPMMLMMGFSVLMLFAMPKLMANMDSEAMDEIQGMQDAAQMPNFEMPDIAATLAKFSTGNSNASKNK